MAVFCPKKKVKVTDKERKPRKEGIKRKQYMEAKPPKIQGLAVTPSGEGRGNGKKPIWVWGALRRKGRKG